MQAVQPLPVRVPREEKDERRAVAVQVAFEKGNFGKPGYHFIGSRVDLRNQDITL
jgi:hypothetical protein